MKTNKENKIKTTDDLVEINMVDINNNLSEKSHTKFHKKVNDNHKRTNKVTVNQDKIAKKEMFQEDKDDNSDKNNEDIKSIVNKMNSTNLSNKNHFHKNSGDSYLFNFLISILLLHFVGTFLWEIFCCKKIASLIHLIVLT